MINGARIKDEIRSLNRVLGTSRSIRTTFNGRELDAYSAVTDDGEEIISLPNIPNNARLNNREAREMRGLADHESFHHRFTDMNMWKRAAEYCQKCNDNVSMRVWNGIEDPRIERLGQKEYKGTQNNLQATVDKWLTLLEEQADAVDAFSFLSIKCAYAGRKFNGMELKSSPKLEEKFAQLGLDKQINAMVDIDDGLELLEAVATFLNEQGIPTLLNFLNDVPPPEEDQSQSNKPESESEGEGDSEDEMKDADLAVVAESFSAELPYYAADDRIYVYPTERGEYIDPRVHGHLTQGFAQALRSVIQRRKDQSQIVGQLNSRRLVGAYNRAENIWLKKRTRDRGYNTALSFVMDHSGSMYDHINELKHLTASLAKSISGLGIAFEISGFYSWPYVEKSKSPFMIQDTTKVSNPYPDSYSRYEPLHIPIVKSFDEPIDYRRLGGLREECMGLTPDSEALELALNRIAKRKEARKIIIILTDGAPQVDKSYVEIAGQEHLARKVLMNHRRSVLEQAKEDGVEVYCIALGHKNTSMYDPDNVVVLNDLHSSGLMRTFYRSITRSQ